MSQVQKSPDILAHWHYKPDLWRDFVQFESAFYKGRMRVAKNIFIAVLILTVAVEIPLIIIPVVVFNSWRWGDLEPAIVTPVCGAFFLFLAGLFWLYRREAFRRFTEQTGEVVISNGGVKTKAESINWKFGEPGLSFKKVERKTVSVSAGKYFEILEFQTVHHYSNSEGRSRTVSELRIPIPFGKEAEAEKIMAQLNARLFSAEQEWIKKNSALGHDFSMDVCRRCGDTLRETTFFSNQRCRRRG